MKTLILACVVLVAVTGVSVTQTAVQEPSVFAAAQSAAGQALYQANCASCHVADLTGRNEAPPLAGPNFMNTWRDRPTADLVSYMQATMPPGQPSLAESDYVNIAAFILQTNGATPGAQALAASTSAPIGSVATGVRAAIGPVPAGAAATEDAEPAIPPSRGLSVAGEVKNYVPVTDAMLRNPDPGDWLMARRNYQAWSYSPLEQITRTNVKDLRLVWSWAMNEAGAISFICRPVRQCRNFSPRSTLPEHTLT